MGIIHSVPVYHVGAALVACPVCAGDFLADQLASRALVLDRGLPGGARTCVLVGKRPVRKPPALKCSFVNHSVMKKPAEAGKTLFFKAYGGGKGSSWRSILNEA